MIFSIIPTYAMIAASTVSVTALQMFSRYSGKISILLILLIILYEVLPTTELWNNSLKTSLEKAIVPFLGLFLIISIYKIIENMWLIYKIKWTISKLMTVMQYTIQIKVESTKKKNEAQYTSKWKKQEEKKANRGRLERLKEMNRKVR